ncbi:integumentary mucin C.1-like [Pempheris klunzingeri]|uniref:integumentary mucin C.1-like n=1 Tax=Pempheris klunzingeri TaxID=3127111 RepID=UPI00397FD313
MLNCSVSTYGECRHTVRWLYEGKDNRYKTTSRSDCSASITVLTSDKPKYHQLFKCEVTDVISGQQFTFSPQSSGEKPEFVTSVPGKDPKAATESTAPTSPTPAEFVTSVPGKDPKAASESTAPTTKPATTTSLTEMSPAKPALTKTSPTTKSLTETSPPTTDSTTKPTFAARAGCSVLDYMMLVIRVAEILLITVITVLLFRARGKQRAADDKTVHHGGDGHDGTVNYENMGEPSASVRLH